MLWPPYDCLVDIVNLLHKSSWLVLLDSATIWDKFAYYETCSLLPSISLSQSVFVSFIWERSCLSYILVTHF
jgi:hypothetical protein